MRELVLNWHNLELEDLEEFIVLPFYRWVLIEVTMEISSPGLFDRYQACQLIVQ